MTEPAPPPPPQTAADTPALRTVPVGPPAMSNVQAELDDIRQTLTPLSASRAVDPNLPADLEGGTNVAAPRPATPTTDPHRVTFVVPQPEGVVVSFGQGGPADRIEEPGITGKTKTHVHWQTFDAPWPTFMVLGDKTKTAGQVGHNGDVPKKTKGFTVVTAGNAWQDSNLHQYLMSRTKDAALVALGPDTRTVVQAAGANGIVDINANKCVTVNSSGMYICAQPGLTYASPVYDQPFTGATGKSTVAHYSRIGGSGVDLVMTAVDYVLAFKKNFMKGEDGKRGWKTDEAHVADAVKWGIDAVKFGYSIYKLKKLFGDDPSAPASAGGVKIAAAGDVGIAAEENASLYGKLTVGMTSLLSASVFSTLTTSIKSLVFAGLAGSYASVKGYRQVKLSSDFGKISIGAKTDVAIDAHDKVKITSKKVSQLNSDQYVYVHGAQALYCAGGRSQGFGLHASSKGIHLGKVDSPSEYEGDKINLTHKIKIDGKGIKTVMGDTYLHVKSSLVKVDCQGPVEIKGSGTAKLDGDKVLIG